MGKTFKDSGVSAAAKRLGRNGGSTTLKKYGKKHFSSLAKDRWKKEKTNKS